MKGSEAVEGTISGLPRRAAMHGIAGSLAGIAAMGAVGAAAKNKNKKNKKKSTKGTLVRVDIVELTGQAPGGPAISPVEAICDAPGSKENVFVLGGGFRLDPDRLEDLILISSFPTTSGGEQGWAVEAENLDTEGIDVTAFAICGYFRKK